jgi:putative SOS response-associated peptidase YedK
LILADEWQGPEDPHQPRPPLHFLFADGGLFCVAALWTSSSSPDGQVVSSWTVVTCEANELVRPVHDRMPVVFAEPELWQAWLHPSLDSAAARELLATMREDGIVLRPASPLVSSAGHDEPDCLALPAAA